MDWPSLYAIGAFIQSLGQNPGIEAELQAARRGSARLRRHRPRQHRHALRRQRRPRTTRSGAGTGSGPIPSATARSRPTSTAHGSDPVEASRGAGRGRRCHAEPERAERRPRLAAYWADRSPELAQYLAELAEIEGPASPASVESGKVARDARPRALRGKLQQQVGSARRAVAGLGRRRVEHPQHAGGADLDARQDHRAGVRAGRRLLDVRRRAQAGAWTRFAARRGQGGGRRRHRSAAAPAHRRRLLQRPRARRRRPRLAAADAAAGHPRRRRIGGLDPRRLRLHDGQAASRALGMEPIWRSASAPTPTTSSRRRSSRPAAAIEQALAAAGASPGRHRHLGSCTRPRRPATTTRSSCCARSLPPTVLGTARKGTFGHGMSAGSGWELTAQYLGFARGQPIPDPAAGERAQSGRSSALHGSFVLDSGRDVAGRGSPASSRSASAASTPASSRGRGAREHAASPGPAPIDVLRWAAAYLIRAEGEARAGIGRREPITPRPEIRPSSPGEAHS